MRQSGSESEGLGMESVTLFGRFTIWRVFGVAFSLLLLLCAMSFAHTVTLTWVLSADKTPLHQNLWRQIGCTGAFKMYAQVPANVATFTDSKVKNGLTYCYYVTMTDKPTKVVSGPSNTATAIIPNP
jgi:hypothetical protein